MPFALTVFEERLNAVVVQTRPIAHVGRFNQKAALRLIGSVQEGRSQQIVERIAE
jgi:hypothetical protein